MLDSWDSLAAVVNCAGGAPFGPMAIAPIARLKMAIEVNVYSSIVLFQHCFERLRRQSG